MMSEISIRWTKLSPDEQVALTGLFAGASGSSDQTDCLGIALRDRAEPIESVAELNQAVVLVMDLETGGDCIVTAVESFEEGSPSISWYFSGAQLTQVVNGRMDNTAIQSFLPSGEVQWDSVSEEPAGSGVDELTSQADATIEEIKEQLRQPFADDAMPVCDVCDWIITDPSGICSECQPLGDVAGDVASSPFPIPGAGSAIPTESAPAGSGTESDLLDGAGIPPQFRQFAEGLIARTLAQKALAGRDEEATDDCNACGATMPIGAKFCIECGAPMKRVCPSCDAQVKPQAKFCTACGTNLQIPPA